MSHVCLPPHLAVLPIFHVLLPVEEPVGDFVLSGVLHDGDDPLHLGGTGQGDTPPEMSPTSLEMSTGA